VSQRLRAVAALSQGTWNEQLWGMQKLSHSLLRVQSQHRMLAELPSNRKC